VLGRTLAPRSHGGKLAGGGGEQTVKMAYREPWMRVTVSSAAEMRLGCGPAWVNLANLFVIIGEVANLQLLGKLPAIDVAVLIAGTVTYVLISLEEVELQVTPYDDRALPVMAGGAVDLSGSTCLLLDAVRVRGAALASPASA